MAKIMTTTGPGFEGYEIEEYIGFVSGQVAIGTNLIQGIAGGVSDNSEKDLAAVENMHEDVLKDLEKHVLAMKGNAVIGLTMNYAELASGSSAIIATGTCVKINKKKIISDNIHKELVVTNYYTRLVPRPVKVLLDGTKQDVKMSVWFYNYNLDDILAVRADVELTNLYDEKLVIKGADFVFNKGNISLIESEYIDTPLTPSDVALLKDAKVIISKYVTPRGVFACNDQPVNVSMSVHKLEALKIKRGIDAVEKYRTDGMIWTCNCGYVNEAGAEECLVCSRKQEDMKSHTSFNYDEMIARMNEKEFVMEIKDVLMEYIKDIDPKYRMELLEIMESGLQYEKTRGNMKDTVIEKVEKVFE